jgi:hypothetical protein
LDFKYARKRKEMIADVCGALTDMEGQGDAFQEGIVETGSRANGKDGITGGGKGEYEN